MYKKALAFLLVVTQLSLLGCSANSQYPSPPVSQTVEGASFGAVGGGVLIGATTGSKWGAAAGAVAGGLIGGFVGHYLYTHMSLVDKLERNGVQVIQLGDQLTLILPSDRFFEQGTSALNPNYKPVLNQVAQLIEGLTKYSVKITGYTDNTNVPAVSIGLSRQQAFTIADYLWRTGIDDRLLYSTGYGQADPIASNTTAKGRAMNRRVEISLTEIQDVPVE